MMDAEQSYFQAAIDDVALGLCRAWNTPFGGPVASDGIRGPIIFNTYQMYLKDSYSRLVRDVERAQRGNYSFGIKLVRGAYMVSERKRSEILSIPDPIHSTLQDTHAAFNSAISFLIDQMSKFPRTVDALRPLAFVVASHNKDSVRLATNLMEKNGIPANDISVGFAQLMGMKDGTTFALARNGYMSYKYIPYGPLDVTIPYLHRRAQENSSMLGTTGEDQKNILTELKIRLGLYRI